MCLAFVAIHLVAIEGDSSVWDVTWFRLVNVNTDDFSCCSYVSEDSFSDYSVTSAELVQCAAPNR